MKEYLIHLSIDFIVYDSDVPVKRFDGFWRYRRIKANNAEEAIKLVSKLEEEKGNKVNYILSCEEIKY